MIDKRLSYKRVDDLEGKLDCTIWLKVNLKGKKSLLFCGGYRQWQILNDKDKNQSQGSNKRSEQFKRYSSIIKNWEGACDQNSDIIIAMDDNLDDSINKKYTYNYQQNLQKLMDLRQKTINERNLMILQTDDTFHRNNVKSRIDHIYTNTVGKINNLQNIKTLFSDHSLLVFNHKTKSKVLAPKFAWKRDKHLLM